jgi:hypothetical protein
MKLDIYEVEEGKDDWELVETIEAETGKECLEMAETKYNIEQFHWTNPY